MAKSVPPFQSSSSSQTPSNRTAPRASSDLIPKQIEAGSDNSVASAASRSGWPPTSQTQSTLRGFDTLGLQSEHLQEQWVRQGQSIGGLAHEIGPAEKIETTQKGQAIPKLLPELRTPVVLHEKPVYESKSGGMPNKFFTPKVTLPILGGILLCIGKIAIPLLFFPGYLLAWLAYGIHTRVDRSVDVDSDEGGVRKTDFVATPNEAGEPRLTPPQIGCL